MVTAQIHFYGVLKGVVPVDAVVVTLPPNFTIGDVVKAVTQRFGAAVKPKLLTSRGHLQSHVRMFVGEQEATGAPDQHFGPIGNGETHIEIFIVPMSEGG